MVSHKQRLIDALEARVPLARVSAGCEPAGRMALRSTAMPPIGLQLPIALASS